MSGRGRSWGGGGLVGSNLVDTALRRRQADAFMQPAIVQARSYAEEVAAIIARGAAADAAGAAGTTVQKSRYFRHSNGGLYYCYSSGTLGTAEPAWINADYVGATGVMTVAGGTATFVACGMQSRPNTKPNPPTFSVIPVNTGGGNAAFKAGSQRITLWPAVSNTDSSTYGNVPDGPQTAGQQSFRSLTGRKYVGTTNSNLWLKAWYQPDSTGGAFASNSGPTELEADVFTDAIVVQANQNGPAIWPVIFIDGQPLLEDQRMANDRSNNNVELLIVFPEGHSKHSIRLEMGDGLTSIYISNRGWIRPATHQVARMIMQADSLGGTNVTSDVGALQTRLPQMLGFGAALGMNIGSTGYQQASVVSGTGLSNNNNARQVIDLNQRTDWKDTASLYLFAHGNNDTPMRAGVDVDARAKFLANAQYCWSKARENQANALIAITGIWSYQFQSGNLASIVAEAENYLYGAWVDWKAKTGDSRTTFQRQFTDATGAANSITKTSTNASLDFGVDTPTQNAAVNPNKFPATMVGARSGGNSNWFNGDGIHQTDYGVWFRTRYMADWLDGELAKLGL
jgi:hypothetical protein